MRMRSILIGLVGPEPIWIGTEKAATSAKEREQVGGTVHKGMPLIGYGRRRHGGGSKFHQELLQVNLND